MGNIDDWTTNDPSLYLPEQSTRDPNFVAMCFLAAVRWPEGSEDMLERLVTPQSRPSWGDFSDVISYVGSMREPGASTKHSRGAEARDVAYVSLLSGVGDGYVLPSGSPLVSDDVLTLVWHQDADSWLVASLGTFVPVAKLERPSIGLAPEVQS